MLGKAKLGLAKHLTGFVVYARFPVRSPDQGSLLVVRASGPSPESPRDLTLFFMRGPFPRQAQGKGNRMA